MLKPIAERCRSYRRFYQAECLAYEDMKSLIAITRFVASAANKQIVRYMVSYESRSNDAIFPCLRWAGYLGDWDGPETGERPAGYILVLLPEDSHRYASFDAALAVQTMLLHAVERGLGGCIIGSIDRKLLREKIAIPEEYRVEVVVALGKPAETVVVDDASSEDIRYWRDSVGTHHVPKLPVDTLILPFATVGNAEKSKRDLRGS